MSQAAAPAGAVTASAPGRIELAGYASGPSLGIAIDRRAFCRVEHGVSGVLVESKDRLTRQAAADVDELVARSPGSAAAQALAVCGATSGLRVVTEWKLPAGSGVDEEGALAVATVAAVAGALGREPPPDELLALAGEAAKRAGGAFCHGVPAAVWGGAVLTHWWNGSAERLAVDPGRVEECLTVVDAGDRAEESPVSVEPPVAGAAEIIAEMLRTGRYDLVVPRLAREGDATAAGVGQRAVIDAVHAAGGAGRPLAGRLVAVWAPPGARGPGPKEAVAAALKAGGWKLLPVRVDLRGLEVD